MSAGGTLEIDQGRSGRISALSFCFATGCRVPRCRGAGNAAGGPDLSAWPTARRDVSVDHCNAGAGWTIRVAYRVGTARRLEVVGGKRSRQQSAGRNVCGPDARASRPDWRANFFLVGELTTDRAHLESASATNGVRAGVRSWSVEMASAERRRAIRFRRGTGVAVRHFPTERYVT